MQKCITALAFIFSVLQSSAQSFEPRFQEPLPDTVSYDQLTWVDFDNDSLLDVLVTGKNISAQTIFSICKNNLFPFIKITQCPG
jgi:hypothetical protein